MTTGKRFSRQLLCAAAAVATLLSTGGVCFSPGIAGEGPAPAPAERGQVLPGVPEATVRAQLLHAAISGSLQVMHRDFFRKGAGKAIPSESLKDVFKTIGEEQGITMRWLATDETAMNRDNLSRDEFGKKALKSITAGEKEVVAVENGTLRFAGAVTLQNECQKCHVPNRKGLEDRFAALEISVPVAANPAAGKAAPASPDKAPETGSLLH